LDKRTNRGQRDSGAGWTDFRERVVYQTYDVTADLKEGKNAIAAMLCPGVVFDSAAVGFGKDITMAKLRQRCVRK